MNHRYQLEPYKGPKSRYTCPECLHRGKTFKRYIDTETNVHLADHVGRCDREENCGYHYTPRQYFKTVPSNRSSFSFITAPVKRPPKPFDTIPQAIVASSLRRYDQNIFCNFLADMLGATAAFKLIDRYQVGTANHWPGATIFWQTDTAGRTRTGKIMLYNAQNCKRVKQPYNHIAWAHRLLEKTGSRESPESRKAAANHLSDLRTSGVSDYQLKQCFFGEHLLAAEPGKPVAITESEKTAIIASYYQPEYIWLAAGSLEGLTVDKCRVLEGRTVVLFPDVNGYHKWQQKANELTCRILTAHFSVDQTLLLNATPNDIANGNDIADRYIDEVLLQWQLLEEWKLRGVDEEEVE